MTALEIIGMILLLFLLLSLLRVGAIVDFGGDAQGPQRAVVLDDAGQLDAGHEAIRSVSRAKRSAGRPTSPSRQTRPAAGPSAGPALRPA